MSNEYRQILSLFRSEFLTYISIIAVGSPPSMGFSRLVISPNLSLVYIYFHSYLLKNILIDSVPST